MPLRQKVAGACAALGLVLALAGCGGAQNPMRTANAAPPFFDGWWDGLWAIPLFVWRITGHVYALHIAHAGTVYQTGWIFGAICFVLVVAWLLRWGIDPPSVIYGALLVLAIFVIVYALRR